MKRTRMTGATNVGEVRLSALDVGFDLRGDDDDGLAGIAVHLPERFRSVGLDDVDGETYLVEGTRDEMIDAIRAAGYRCDV